jgi:hypothetical protein
MIIIISSSSSTAHQQSSIFAASPCSLSCPASGIQLLPPFWDATTACLCGTDLVCDGAASQV